MKREHVIICEKHIRYWHKLKYSLALYSMPKSIVNELIIVLQEHLKSRETICTWCPDSQSYLLTQVYQAYERDAENPIIANVLNVIVEYPNGKPTLSATDQATAIEVTQEFFSNKDMEAGASIVEALSPDPSNKATRPLHVDANLTGKQLVRKLLKEKNAKDKLDQTQPK